MDGAHFDSLTRSLSTMGSRRILLGTPLAVVFGLLGRDAADAKKQKPCPPCKKRKQGKCTGTRPEGTGCTDAAGRRGTCRRGSCVATALPPSPRPNECAALFEGALCGGSGCKVCRSGVCVLEASREGQACGNGGCLVCLGGVCSPNPTNNGACSGNGVVSGFCSFGECKSCSSSGRCCDNIPCCGKLVCDPREPRCLANRTCGCADGRPRCANTGLCCLETEVCDDGPGGVGGCAAQSDRNLKANIGSVDPADMLERVRTLPISTWNYTSDDAAVRHIGPMAQDFAALFGVGADDRHIHPSDGQGVALAAIQGLIAELAQVRDENSRLAARLERLEDAPPA